MNATRFAHLTIRAVTMGALIAGTASMAMAQNVTPPSAATVEKSTLTLAREDPQFMVKGIALNAIEQKAFSDVERKYAREFKALEREFNNALRDNRLNASVFARVETLRSQQRSEIRGMLTEKQQVVFDVNMAAR